MATLDLNQRGLSLVAKNPRLVASLNRPRIEGVYDQCGILAYVKTAGSYSVLGRITCADRMVELLRLSYSYMFKAPELVDEADDLNFKNIRATENSISEVRFGGADAPLSNPVETTMVRAFYTLEDQCSDPIGNVEVSTFSRFEFDETNCRLSLLTSFSTTLAVNSVITDPEPLHDALGGFFKGTDKAGGVQAPTTAAWIAIGNNPVVLDIPGFESVVV